MRSIETLVGISRLDGADALARIPFTTKAIEEKKKRERERQLPLGADPSSGEQTFQVLIHSSSYHLY